MIIHTGTKNKSAIGLAEDVLSAFPEGLSGLGNCCLQELTALDGIGSTKACRILGAVELGKRISAMSARERMSISSSDDVAKLFMEELRYVKKEHFKSLLLNAKGDIISIESISVGELSSTVVHPREVFSMAVRKSASAVIFVHNHPSGDATPSEEDIETTRRLMECGVLLGIKVLDHIIIGDGLFCSMREMGHIK
jgi:DNA repair protein RadC